MKMAVVSSFSSSTSSYTVLILALLLLHSDSGDFSAESCRTSYYTLYLSEEPFRAARWSDSTTKKSTNLRKKEPTVNKVRLKNEAKARILGFYYIFI